MTSWIVFGSAAENCECPVRLAGTIRQYSTNAIPQLITMTVIRAVDLNLRSPYQAKVMNTFDASNQPMVVTATGRVGISDLQSDGRFYCLSVAMQIICRFAFCRSPQLLSLQIFGNPLSTVTQHSYDAIWARMRA